MNETSVLIEGELNLLLGKPAAGKSFLAAALAADVSRGRQPMTGEPRHPGTVFYLASEERAETIAGRLEAAGADLRRVAVLVQSLAKHGLRRLPVLAKAGDAALVAFDPLPPYSTAADHGDLTAFVAWAKANGVTVLAAAHETAASRSVLTLSRAAFLVSRDRFSYGRRFLLPLKHPALTRAMPFSIEQPEHEVDASPRVMWSQHPVGRSEARLPIAAE